MTHPQAKILLTNLLSCIAYRFSKSIHTADSDFFNMQIKNHIRQPIEIVHHMSEGIRFCLHLIKKYPEEKLRYLDFPEEVERFYMLLKELDGAVNDFDLSLDLTLRLIHGPLSDVLTHIGQIALLRRYSNDPVKNENFGIVPVITNRYDHYLNELGFYSKGGSIQ